MSHAHSGLPKLDLEPFDPTPLYAAASSPRRDDTEPRHRTKGSRLLIGVVAALTVLAVAGGLASLVLR